MLCMKCGEILNQSQIQNGNGKCPYCGSDNLSNILDQYDFTFGDYFKICNISKDPQFIIEMIKLKNEDLIEYQLKLKQFKQQSDNCPKCPTCQSTDIKKISTVSKTTNAVLFGLFGNKRNKQFHCNSCGYEW